MTCYNGSWVSPQNSVQRVWCPDVQIYFCRWLVCSWFIFLFPNQLCFQTETRQCCLRHRAMLTQTQLDPGFALMKNRHRCRRIRDKGIKRNAIHLFILPTSMSRLFHKVARTLDFKKIPLICKSILISGLLSSCPPTLPNPPGPGLDNHNVLLWSTFFGRHITLDHNALQNKCNCINCIMLTNQNQIEHLHRYITSEHLERLSRI